VSRLRSLTESKPNRYRNIGKEHWRDNIEDVYTEPVSNEKLGKACGLTAETTQKALGVAMRDGLIVASPTLARSWRFVPEAMLALPSGYKTKNIQLRAAACERKMLRAVRAKFYRNPLHGQKILMSVRGKGEPPVTAFTDPPELMPIGEAWPAQHPRRMRPPNDGESVCSVETSSYWGLTKRLSEESGLPRLGSRCECGVDLNDTPAFQHERGVFCSHPAHHDAVEMVEETIDPEVSKQISADCQHDLHQGQPFLYALAAFNCAGYEVIEAEHRQRKAA
jgi:hypothetical protein